MRRSWVIQLVWIVLAAALFVAAGQLDRWVAFKGEEYQFTSGDQQVAREHPEIALLTIAPGGLRAPVVAYLWIRASDYKEAGRYHDALQLASLICKLQPRFPNVWSFQAWNMAWNISVATHTPEERWQWVYNGVKLLRDDGIPMNPEALLLYKELAWIYLFKIGEYTDDMNLAYKRRWAYLMQQVLAAPPSGSVEDVVTAFRPITEAPLDKSRHVGAPYVQNDQRDILLKDPAVADYVRRLGSQGVTADMVFMEAYNRYTTDPAVAVTRVTPPPTGDTPREKVIAKLINSPGDTAARNKLLAFVRAQVLWNQYKLDPDWMLHLMETYGPLDWRSPLPHGLYWVTYGLDICRNVPTSDFDRLATDRVLLNCLKRLTDTGRVTYEANPVEPEWPRVWLTADLRYIPIVQKTFIDMADKVVARSGGKYTLKDNPFRAGHENYLIMAMQALWAFNQRQAAQRYYDYLRQTYGFHGGSWEMDLENFLIDRINAGGAPNKDFAETQLYASLLEGFVALSQDNSEANRRSLAWAARVYQAYQKDVPDRNKLPPFDEEQAIVLMRLLVNPRGAGYNLNMEDRSALYRRLGDGMKLKIYDSIALPLKQQCELEKVDFDLYFPAPPGLDAYRRYQKSLMRSPE